MAAILKLGNDDIVLPAFLLGPEGPKTNATILLEGLNIYGGVALAGNVGGTGLQYLNPGAILCGQGAAAALVMPPLFPAMLSHSGLADESPVWSATLPAEIVIGSTNKLDHPRFIFNSGTGGGGGGWYNGETQTDRAFFGMHSNGNTVFRLYSTQLGGQVMTWNLANGDVSIISGNLTTYATLKLGAVSPASITGNNDAKLLTLATAAGTPVNYCEIANAATASPVIISAAGTDANVGLTIASKGAAQIVIKDGAANIAAFSSAGLGLAVGSYSGNGSGLTSLNAGQLSSGIVPIGRLSYTSAAFAGAITDETGLGTAGKLMFSEAPVFTGNPSPGAGAWYNGNVTANRAFVGMNAGSDTIWRIYSAALGTNAWSIDLPTGTITIVDGTSTNPAMRFVNGHGIWCRDPAQKTITFSAGLGAASTIEFATASNLVVWGDSTTFFFNTFTGERNFRDSAGIITRMALASVGASGTTDVNDPELTVNLAAGKQYSFTISAGFAVADATQQLKCGVTFTSAPTFFRQKQELLHTSVIEIKQTTGTAATQAFTGATTAGLEYQVRITGSVQTSAATTMRLSFAKNVATGTDLIRIQGSQMQVYKGS
jgi:hypothetical protein